jgi:hypothetical protein
MELFLIELIFGPSRYITHSDMCEMLCTSDGKMDSTVLKMWHDGLKEIKCKADDKITFEEFQKFLKGQVPKEAMLPNLRNSSAARRLSNFALQSVPESSATSKLARDSEDNLISFEAIVPRTRATRATSVILPPPLPMVRDGDDDCDLPHKTHRDSRKEDQAHSESEAYRKRQEFRMSVLHASKLFDQKRQARQPVKPSNPAGLTMIAGPRRPSAGGTNLTEKEATMKLAAASKKSGRRNRNNRKKTKSDLSLLLR